MKRAVWNTLAATELMGVWFAVAQTNTKSPPKKQQSAIQVDISPIVAVSTGGTNSVIAVSTNALAVESVSAGKINERNAKADQPPPVPQNLRIVAIH
jgi:hypothetical protein